MNLTRIAGPSGKKEPAAKSVGALESWEPRSLTAVRVLSLGLAIDWGETQVSVYVCCTQYAD